MSNRIIKKLNPIKLDYSLLLDTKINLRKEIEVSFGKNGNGIILIDNIPNYTICKNKLLPLAKKIHLMPSEVKRKYERPETNYVPGICTFDRFHYQGVKDMATSWYAKALKDVHEPVKFIENGKEKIFNFPNNFWPTEELPELEPAFKEMSKIGYEVQSKVSFHLEKLIKSLAPTYELGKIENFTSFPFGRLIHYHTSVEFAEHNKDEAVYLHNDTSTLTALCSPIYMDENNKVVPDLTDEEGHGLEILKSDGNLYSLSIPKTCLAIQLGEIMQIISGGTLEPTPHRVIATKYPTYTREQFALFMEPTFDTRIGVPEGFSESDVYSVRPGGDKVIDLKETWKNNITFRELLGNSYEQFIK